MRSLPFLLIASLALLMVGEVNAESESSKEPEWGYNLGGARSVAISADGEYIAAGSWDNKVYLFDKNSSTPLWSYDTGGGNEVKSIAISADGDYIAAGYMDKVSFFHKDSNEPLWAWTPSTSQSTVYSVVISADGRHIVVGYRGGIAFLQKDNGTYDGDGNLMPLWSYGGEDSEIMYTVAISADGRYIAAGEDEPYHYGKVHLFEKNSSTPLWSYTAENRVWSVDISADGEYIAAGSNDDKVYLFDRDSSTPLWNYIAEDGVTSVSISADGEYLVAGSYDNNVYFFNKDNNTPLWSYNTGKPVYSAAISADGEYIAAGGESKEVYLFTKDNSTPLWSYTAENRVQSVDISADGEYIAAGSFDDSCSSCPQFYLFNKDTPPIASIDSFNDYGGAYKSSSVRFDEEFTFAGSGTDRDGTIVAYQWNSSHNSQDWFLSDEKNFSKTGFWVIQPQQGQQYNPQTIHMISFRVQDNDGYWSEWVEARLYVDHNDLPEAWVSITPSPAEKGWTVSFSGTASDNDGTVTSYLWNSSIDGELSTEKNFSSNNLSIGLHYITLQVQDNEGGVFTYTREIKIYALPVAIAGDDITLYIDDNAETSDDNTATFRGQGTDEDGHIVLYEWDFDGNGFYDHSSTENGRTTHYYGSVGNYNAVLRVTDDEGFTSMDYLVVKIRDNSDKDNDDDSEIPTISVTATIIAVATIARCRRY